MIYLYKAIILVAMILCVNTASAAGLSFDERHRVIATTQDVADFTLATLNQSVNTYRINVPLIVSVEISSQESRVLVWCKDTPERKFHRVWIVAAQQNEVLELLEYAVRNIKLYEEKR